MELDKLKIICAERKLDRELDEIKLAICKEHKEDPLVIECKYDLEYFNMIFGKVCELGNIDIFNIMMDITTPNIAIGFQTACMYKQCDIIIILLKLGYNKQTESGYNFVNYGLYGACQGGHIDIVELMIKAGADCYEVGMMYACSGGHKVIVEMMIKLGATSYNPGLWNACKNKHKDIAIMMIDSGIEDLNHALSAVCEAGYKDLAIRIIALGADSCNAAYSSACSTNNVDLAQYLLDTGKVSDVDFGLYGACESKNIEMVKWALSKGANDYDIGVFYSCKVGFLEGLDYLIPLSNDYDNNRTSMEEIVDMHEYEVIKHVMEREYKGFYVPYEYPSHKRHILTLLEIKMDIKYLRDIYGYDELASDINNFRSNVDTALSPHLLSPIINIIKSYSLL